MPQQPVTLELSATISDKTFPIGSFTVNIPVKVTHTEVNTFKVGGGYTTLITPNHQAQTNSSHDSQTQSKHSKQHSKPTPTGRGGEILKTTPNRPTVRVVGLSLPDDVFC